MPQLDVAISFNQFFWFFVFFLGIYSFITYVIIPKINFYYFIKYNIWDAFSQIENSLRLENIVNVISTQITGELEYVYSSRLHWFEKVFDDHSLIFPESVADMSICDVARIQNYVIIFIPREFYLGVNFKSIPFI